MSPPEAPAPAAPPDQTAPHPARDKTIWLFALGYAACYLPYSALTKSITDGGLGRPRTGLEILPLSVMVSLAAMVVFLWASGWWRAASVRWKVGPLTVPLPRRWTLVSGLATAAVLVTTTLAYSFQGVSIVLMMLLMRGGVLILAPIVDLNTRRRVPWTTWAALVLSMASLIVATSHRADVSLTLVAVVDVVVNLAAYFVRLYLMSQLAKTESKVDLRRYFVEEQLVTSPAAFAVILLLALVLPGGVAMGDELRRGFLEVPLSAQAGVVALVGVFSQGTGIFGALVLLDARENSFTVPVNRGASVLAGVAATWLLQLSGGSAQVDVGELVGAGLVAVALVVLAAPMRHKHMRLADWQPRLPPEQ